MTWPSRDKNVPHPGMVFDGSQWRDPEKRRENWARSNAKTNPVFAPVNNPRRVFVGSYYAGYAPTAEQAATLNDQARKEFA